MASSADGTKLVAVSIDYIYTSADSGATWTQTSAQQAGLVLRGVVSRRHEARRC